MSRTLRAVFNESNANKLPSAGLELPLGDALGVLPHFVRAAVVSNVLALPSNLKAARVVNCYSVAGTLTGPLTPTNIAVPTTGLVGTSASGDILFAPADAVTFAEVTYIPFEGPVISDLVQVAASVGTLLQGRGAQKILSVTVNTGLVLGAKTVDVRGTAGPAAGHAASQNDPTLVNFNATDVVTGTATITYVAQPGMGTTPISVGAQLEALVDF